MRIYMASKTKHADKWKALRAGGVNIISTWIDEAGAGESSDLGELAMRCILEASRHVDRVILYAEEGDVLKGAYIEVGAALARGVPVYAVGPVISQTSAFRHHPLWFEGGTLEEALTSV